MVKIVLLQLVWGLFFLGVAQALAPRSPQWQQGISGFIGLRSPVGHPRSCLDLVRSGGLRTLTTCKSFETSLHSTQEPLPAPRENFGLKEIPLLTFVDWGRGPTPPGTTEEFVLQMQRHSTGRSSKDICGLFYCTSWDPRSKALISALRVVQTEALEFSVSQGIHQDESPSSLPLYSLTGIKVNNSLVIARGRRAILKQSRMACNMKQLRHNERALRFMLQQQQPLQLKDLPAIQFYAQQREEGGVTSDSHPVQLLEIRSVSPLALQQLGAKDGPLSGEWWPQGPSEGPQAGRSLGVWLKRLGEVYVEELRRTVEARRKQAEEEYPIYKTYNP